MGQQIGQLRECFQNHAPCPHLQNAPAFGQRAWGTPLCNSVTTTSPFHLSVSMSAQGGGSVISVTRQSGAPRARGPHRPGQKLAGNKPAGPVPSPEPHGTSRVVPGGPRWREARTPAPHARSPYPGPARKAGVPASQAGQGRESRSSPRGSRPPPSCPPPRQPALARREQRRPVGSPPPPPPARGGTERRAHLRSSGAIQRPERAPRREKRHRE